MTKPKHDECNDAWSSPHMTAEYNVQGFSELGLHATSGEDNQARAAGCPHDAAQVAISYSCIVGAGQMEASAGKSASSAPAQCFGPIGPIGQFIS